MVEPTYYKPGTIVMVDMTTYSGVVRNFFPRGTETDSKDYKYKCLIGIYLIICYSCEKWIHVYLLWFYEGVLLHEESDNDMYTFKVRIIVVTWVAQLNFQD